MGVLDYLVPGVSLLSGLFGGNKSPDASIPWQTQAMNTAGASNMWTSNPIGLGAYFKAAAASGFGEDQLQQYANTLPMNNYTRILGYTPLEGYGAAKEMPTRNHSYTWGNYTAGIPHGKTKISAAGTSGAGTGGTSSGATPEEQSIINKGYSQQADTINSNAEAMYNQLRTNGIDPAQARQMSSTWAIEQKSRAKLTGEQGLMQQSVGEYYNRLLNLYQMSQGQAPKYNDMSGAYLAANNANDQNSASMWGGIANLLGSYAQMQNPVMNTSVGSSLSSAGTYAAPQGTSYVQGQGIVATPGYFANLWGG
jgi:hypothetical protein